MRCCHNTHSLLFRGCAGGCQRRSAAVCDPNPPASICSVQTNSELSEFLGPHQAFRRELSDFLSAYCSCDAANSPSFFPDLPSLTQRNSAISCIQDSTFETIFRTFLAKCHKTLSQDVGKGGLSLRGVAFMTVLAVLAVLESTLPSFCLSYKLQCQETTVTVWRFWRFRRFWPFRSWRLPPSNSTPLFRHPDFLTFYDDFWLIFWLSPFCRPLFFFPLPQKESSEGVSGKKVIKKVTKASEHVSNGIFMRTRQKQECATFVWNTTERDARL